MFLPLYRFKHCITSCLISLCLIACGGGGGSPPVACTVGNVNLTYAIAAQLAVGSSINIRPSGVPVTCAGVTYNLSGSLPAGITLDNTTGVLSGTVTQLSSNTFTITVVLPSGAGSAASTPITVAVVVTPKVTVSGVARNTVLVNKFDTNGALDFANPVIKPMRGVTVEVVQNGAVLSSTNSDDSGNYSFSLPVNTGSIYLRIKAVLKSTNGATWDVQVKDNVNGEALYALSSANFDVATANVTQDMTAGSGWSIDGEATGVRASAPFAILDTVYSAMKKVVEVAPTTAFPAVTIFWSVDNTTATGNVAQGLIGGSYFSSRTSGGVTTRVSYILGKEGVDTDEFDETVVAHEWGHYAQSAFSRDDSVGGSHTFGDKLDMRVAFSEGWGNAWSGIATGRSKYADSAWRGSVNGGFTINLATSPTTASNRGWFSEMSVLYTIYDLNRQVGFGPIWQALRAMSTTPALTSIYSFQANLPTSAAAPMAALMSSQGNTGTGIYGDLETNQSSFPPYRTITVGAPASTVCLSAVNGTSNKLGNYAALKFNNPTAGTRTFTVTGGTDPDFDVFQTRLKLRAGTANAGSEIASVSLTAGDAVLVVNDDALTSGSVCLSVRIQ